MTELHQSYDDHWKPFLEEKDRLNEQQDGRITSEDIDWEALAFSIVTEETQSTNSNSMASVPGEAVVTAEHNLHDAEMETNLQHAWDYLSRICVSTDQDRNCLANLTRAKEFPSVFKHLVEAYYESVNTIRPVANQQTRCGLSIKGKSGCFVLKENMLSEIRLIKSQDKKSPATWEISVILPSREENEVDLPIHIIFPISIGMLNKSSYSHSSGRIVKTFCYSSNDRVSQEKEDLKVIISGYEKIYPIKVYTSRSSKTKQTYFEFEASFL